MSEASPQHQANSTQSKKPFKPKSKTAHRCLASVWGCSFSLRSSEEGPGTGLAFFKGKNMQLPNTVKVPHMGWNTLNIVKPNELFDGIAEGTYVYFVHSLYPVPKDKTIVCTTTEYGTTFTSAVASKNIYGTQFHPEKSGDVGLKILKKLRQNSG